MINQKQVTAIILVAGNSTRYGKNRNKNFELIEEKHVLEYSLEAFNKNTYVDNIIVAVKENEKQEVTNIINRVDLSKNVDVVIGGKTRKESVYNCITATNSDIVIIHDGARPFVKQEYITNCIENMKDYKGVTVGIKPSDTVKISDENNIVVNTTKRSDTWLIQTPQCFDRDILVKMHEKYKNDEVTDDCSLLEKDNYKIKVIPGGYTNLKITTSEDMDVLKMFFDKSHNF